MQWSFSELGEHFFDIDDIFAVRQLAQGKTVFTTHTPRATDALLLFAHTTGICYQKDRPPFFIPRGSLVYMPHDSMYMWENSPVGAGDVQENLLFEFTLRTAALTRSADEKRALSRRSGEVGERISLSDRVTLLSVAHTGLYESLFRTLIDAFSAEPLSPAAVYEAAYAIFRTVAADVRTVGAAPSSDERLLRPALARLTGESEPEGVQVGELAALCHVSVSYFTRVFRRYTGMTVGEYRSLQQLNRVKRFLHEEGLSLSAISEALGYCDSGYLCRRFKKQTGMTPGEYRRLLRQENYLSDPP